MKQEELWKDIEGYEGRYQISSCGLVKSLFFKKPRLKYIGDNGTGYKNVTLIKNRVTECVYIHRLVAFHFIENPENKSQVNHLNSNRNDNRSENLEWVTPIENIHHGMNYGEINNQGSNSGMSKLSQSDVKEIREQYLISENLQYLRTYFSKKFNVHEETIRNVYRNKKYFDPSFEPKKVSRGRRKKL